MLTKSHHFEPQTSRESNDAASRWVDRKEKGNTRRSYRAVLKFDYRLRPNLWAYVQPTLQNIIRPGGRGLIANDPILGIQPGASF